MDIQPHALEITPDSELVFELSRDSSTTSKCTMMLRHPGNTDEHLAFKVKTTQPRRYLVRPNQGLISPLNSETIQIFLVDKDKQTLLQSYDRLGQTALDHSKDKFLVQSCCVSREFATQYLNEKVKVDKLNVSNKDSDVANKANKDLAEVLTGMWNAVTSGGGSNPTFNKKLHVKHIVVTPNSATTASRGMPSNLTKKQNHEPIDKMTPEQTYAELNSLRRKYDELVSFSVNLTAERDILNNTLEQTKRELNREMSQRHALENSKGGTSSRSMNSAKGSKAGGGGSFVGTIVQLFVVGSIFFLGGVKLCNENKVDFISNVPVVGPLVFDSDAAASTSSSNQEEL